MTEPVASRPYMPGYGIAGPEEGHGLLPWSWAEERLAAARNYWMVTTWPDGRPHAMPVWAVWDEQALWFSSSGRSRKVRNLRHDPRCVVATENAMQPVVLEGVASIVTDPPVLRRVIDGVNAKYDTSFDVSFLDPAVNATVKVTPTWAFALDDDAFEDTPTRWDLSS
jgi:PPOX class probable F420-dependent enzyme